MVMTSWPHSMLRALDVEAWRRARNSLPRTACLEGRTSASRPKRAYGLPDSLALAWPNRTSREVEKALQLLAPLMVWPSSGTRRAAGR